MEARVRILEKTVEAIGESLGRLERKLDGIDQGVTNLREKISYLEGKVQGLPTSWQMIATVIGGNAALAAMFYGVLRLFIH